MKKRLQNSSKRMMKTKKMMKRRKKMKRNQGKKKKITKWINLMKINFTNMSKSSSTILTSTPRFASMDVRKNLMESYSQF